MNLLEQLAEILHQTEEIGARISAADADEMEELEAGLERRNQRLRALLDAGIGNFPKNRVAELLQQILDADAINRQALQDGQRDLQEMLQAARRSHAAAQSYSEVESN